LPTTPLASNQPQPARWRWQRIIPIVAFLFIFAIPLIAILAHNKTTSKGQQNQNNITLKQTGVKIQATITNIRQDFTYKVGSQYPYVVDAQWQDPATGKQYLFHSDWLWQDPSFKLRGINFVTVYVNPNNYNTYYMDLRQLSQ